MIYIKTFKLSTITVRNNNIYPFSVLHNKAGNVFIFDKITVLYGSNGCGKSTILNIMANKLDIEGKERDSPPIEGHEPYFEYYANSCTVTFGEDEFGRTIYKLPSTSRYFKSEEILYEVRKIQQDAVLQESMKVAKVPQKDFKKIFNNIQFSQNKFSNGETTMQFLQDRLTCDSLFLLDEPEVSLSPQNQVKLAQMINHQARLLNNQFIISTHSPFMLGTLNAKIYDLDTPCYDVKNWVDLENVRYFYDFFISRKDSFNN